MEIFHGLKFKSFIENSIKEKKELPEPTTQPSKDYIITTNEI